jgi:hypothetical protein
MRLWSLHPCFLDAKGLSALWRESLLAKKVLQGKTVGYRSHPQLARFKGCGDPLAALESYLDGVYLESVRRGYHFDRSKLGGKKFSSRIPVTRGQMEFERLHLDRKLKRRDPLKRRELRSSSRIRLHPLFKETSGAVEPWEKVASKGNADDR